jgi:hypothetical protein
LSRSNSALAPAWTHRAKRALTLAYEIAAEGREDAIRRGAGAKPAPRQGCCFRQRPSSRDTPAAPIRRCGTPSRVPVERWCTCPAGAEAAAPAVEASHLPVASYRAATIRHRGTSSPAPAAPSCRSPTVEVEVAAMAFLLRVASGRAAATRRRGMSSQVLAAPSCNCRKAAVEVEAAEVVAFLPRAASCQGEAIHRCDTSSRGLAAQRRTSRMAAVAVAVVSLRAASCRAATIHRCDTSSPAPAEWSCTRRTARRQSDR